MERIVLFHNGERGKVVATALEEGGHTIIDTFTPRTFPSVARLRKLKPRLSVVAGFPLRFSAEMIAVPELGTINCHAGPVPSYRGGSPLNWQIINGAERIWVSVLQMDEGLDTGPVLSTTSFYLGPDETIADAHRKANIAFAEAVTSVVWLMENDQVHLEARQQNHPEPAPPRFYSKGTPQSFYKALQKPKTWPQRNDDMGQIDSTWPAKRIHNFVRALTHPYPGAWIKGSDGKRVRVWETSIG